MTALTKQQKIKNKHYTNIIYFQLWQERMNQYQVYVAQLCYFVLISLQKTTIQIFD